jgi:hypothetical protein
MKNKYTYEPKTDFENRQAHRKWCLDVGSDSGICNSIQECSLCYEKWLEVQKYNKALREEQDEVFGLLLAMTRLMNWIKNPFSDDIKSLISDVRNRLDDFENKCIKVVTEETKGKNDENSRIY